MRLAVIGSVLAVSTAFAQVPAILIEACSQMEPAAKRVECLQAANQVAPRAGSSTAPTPSSANSFAARPPAAIPAAPAAPAPNTNFTTSSGSTCYVGPRGGTYTITRSGKKNYSGC